MPTLWHYIDRCPFERECMANHTSLKKKKKVVFYGTSEEEAQEKCVQHLMNSSLHNKTHQVAWEKTRKMPMKTYEEPTDEEASDEEKAEVKEEKADSWSGGDSGDSEGGSDHERPWKRRHLAMPNTASDSKDPLVEEMTNNIFGKVSSMLSTSHGRSSSSDSSVRGLRAAMQHIKDAEDAATKAQAIAANATQAFGEVAKQLNRAFTSLDALV